jgi:hypothetical protein
VSEYSYCLIAVLECLPVRVDIHAIGKSAYDKYFRTELPQVVEKVADNIFSIESTFACTYHVDDTLLVKIGIPFVKEYKRSVRTVFEALWIVFVYETKRLNVVVEIIIQFHFGSFHRFIQILKSPDEPWRGIREDVFDVVSMLNDRCC